MMMSRKKPNYLTLIICTLALLTLFIAFYSMAVFTKTGYHDALSLGREHSSDHSKSNDIQNNYILHGPGRRGWENRDSSSIKYSDNNNYSTNNNKKQEYHDRSSDNVNTTQHGRKSMNSITNSSSRDNTRIIIDMRPRSRDKSVVSISKVERSTSKHKNNARTTATSKKNSSEGHVPGAGAQVLFPTQFGNHVETSSHVRPFIHPDVKVVSSYLGADKTLPYEDCVTMPQSLRQGVYICLHPVKDDNYVSGTLKRNGLWEADLIRKMSNYLRSAPSLQLVDLGCNIGQYTIWVAAMGRPVLAVEMLQSNIQLLQRSLELSKLTTNVTIVHNALYSDHRELDTMFIRGNLGGSRLDDSADKSRGEIVDGNKTSVKVNSICMDDLIPLVRFRNVFLKIDIENSESQALSCAHQFFDQLDIWVVQMEWLWRTQEEGTFINSFMSQHGYVPSKTPDSFVYVDTNVPTIAGHDVYFLKRTHLF